MSEAKNQIERFTVNYPDGTQKSFTKRTSPDGLITVGKLFTSSEVKPDGFETKVYLSDGNMKTFSLAFDSPANTEFGYKLAARGSEELLKNAVTGISDFEPKFDENGVQINKTVHEAIAAKLEEFANREFNTRLTGSGVTEIFSVCERAYAAANEYNLSDPDDVAAVKQWYASLDKQTRKNIIDIGGQYYLEAESIRDEIRAEKRQAALELHLKIQKEKESENN
jgi:hypothetical protein